MPGDLPWPPRFRSSPGGNPAAARARLEDISRRLWSTVRLVSASTLDVPDMEFKLAAGELLHVLVSGAARVERRSEQLGRRVRPYRHHCLDHTVASALTLQPVPDRLAVLGHRWLPDLSVAVASALDASDPLLDAPSAAALRATGDELAHVLPWFGEAADSAGCDRQHADKLWDALADSVSRPTRPVNGARDDRFTTFSDTRDYRSAPGWNGTGSEYEDDLLELAWVNRDELDAVETFALTLFDLVDEADLEVLEHLARLAWDEARHSAIGHAVLAASGTDPFTLPSSTIGIRLRGAMSGWDAWAQITLYGELSIIRPMRELAAAARCVGDRPTAESFEFICSDEAMHLRESRVLLDRFHPAGGLEAVSDQVRRRAAELLDEQGVLPREHYLALTRQEIFRMIGE
jgi:hypothetical protein